MFAGGDDERILTVSDLTPKQERFAQLYVDTGNASEAYRIAYNSKAKYSTVNVSASKLLAEPKIALRVKQIREEIAEEALWTRVDSLNVLAEIARRGDKDSDKINAVKAINAMMGFDKGLDKSQDTTQPININIIPAKPLD